MTRKICLSFLVMFYIVSLSSCKLPQPGATGPEDTSESTTFQDEINTSTPVLSSPQAIAPTGESPTVTPKGLTPTPLPPTPTQKINTSTPVPEPTLSTEGMTRVQIPPGNSSVLLDGELNAGDTMLYVMQATTGTTMSIDIWSPNSDVFLEITETDNGGSLLNFSDHKTRWDGTFPKTQDYIIGVYAENGRTSYSIEVLIASVAVSESPSMLDPYVLWGEPSATDPMTIGSLYNWAEPNKDLPNTENIRLTLENAKFYVTGKNLDFSTWWFSWPSLSDFYIELTVDTLTCSGDDAYGLIIRGPEHKAGVSYGYVVAFSCDGHYWIYRLDGAEPFSSVDLVSWTKSEHIRTGSDQMNVLGIKADGDSITVYANGNKLIQVVDNRYDKGRYGLFVRASNTYNYTYRPVKIAYWDFSE